MSFVHELFFLQLVQVRASCRKLLPVECAIFAQAAAVAVAVKFSANVVQAARLLRLITVH